MHHKYDWHNYNAIENNTKLHTTIEKPHADKKLQYKLSYEGGFHYHPSTSKPKLVLSHTKLASSSSNFYYTLIIEPLSKLLKKMSSRTTVHAAIYHSGFDKYILRLT